MKLLTNNGFNIKEVKEVSKIDLGNIAAILFLIGALVYAAMPLKNKKEIVVEKEVSEVSKVIEMQKRIDTLTAFNSTLLKDKEVLIESNYSISSENEALLKENNDIKLKLNSVTSKYENALIKSGSVKELVTSSYKDGKDAIVSAFKKEGK